MEDNNMHCSFNQWTTNKKSLPNLPELCHEYWITTTIITWQSLEQFDLTEFYFAVRFWASRGFSEVFSTQKAWKSASDDSDPDSCEKSLGWKWIEVVGPYEAWGPVVSPFLKQENGTLCASLTQTESELPQIHLFLKAKEFVISIVCQARKCVISIQHLTSGHTL